MRGEEKAMNRREPREATEKNKREAKARKRGNGETGVERQGRKKRRRVSYRRRGTREEKTENQKEKDEK